MKKITGIALVLVTASTLFLASCELFDSFLGGEGEGEGEGE
jgi:hypothetical protein